MIYKKEITFKMSMRKYNNIGDARNLDEFVSYKVNKLKASPKNFDTLYNLMFSEPDNCMFEDIVNYKIHKYTYREVYNVINERSDKLKGLLRNVSKNSYICLYLDSGINWIESFWMILKAGYNPVLINKRLSEENIIKSIKAIDAKYVISNEDVRELFGLRNITLSEIDGCIRADEESLFGSELVIMSSGTSNTLKLCVYTYDELYYLIINSYRLMKSSKQVKKHYEGELKLLCFLPFYHIFGLVAMYLWFGFFSRTFVNLPSYDGNTILYTIKRHKVTHIFAVPLLWTSIYKAAILKIKSKGEDVYKKFEKGLKIKRALGNSMLGNLFTKLAFKEVREQLYGDSISYLISGGSMIEKDVLEFFNAIGYHLANGYGMSEVSITSFELSNNYKILTSSSIGLPFENVTYKISESNELLIKTKSRAKKIISVNVCTGDVYVDSANEEFYNSQDLAKCENNRYFLLGRCDDVIVLDNGENINPNVLEEELKVENVNDICLINDHNKCVLLVSINKYISQNKFNDIEKDLRDRIEKANLNNAISKIYYTSSNLLSASDFKLNRKKVEERYLNNEYIEYSNKTLLEEVNEIEKKIRSYFALALEKDEEVIGLDDSFFLDLGGTSLDYFALISELEKEFSVTIPSESLKLDSVRKIAEYIGMKL